MRRAAGIAAAVLMGWFGAAGAAGAAPALWKVSDADSEIYLFGTLHALNPATKWRTPAYDVAYARASSVWFEADLGRVDPASMDELLRRYGVDTDRPLSKKLTAADLGALARKGVDVRRIDHLRPWAAALMLSMQPTLGRGATVEAGADFTMTRAARTQAKRLRAFETLEDQARMFASLPESSEVQYLSNVLRARGVVARLRSPSINLEQAWLAGDLAKLGPGLVGDLRRENPDLYDALLKRRNERWAEQLVGVLEGEGVDLVNVGALHMVGDDGLPTLLAARGFKVERIQ
jgi:uncharacterized protein YbaP (TraB family)